METLNMIRHNQFGDRQNEQLYIKNTVSSKGNQTIIIFKKDLLELLFMAHSGKSDGEFNI